MANWKCIKNCGACCQLNPDERPDLEEYLTPAQLSQYLSMVGEEGWCIHFDRQTRLCTIYDQRPEFCRGPKNRRARTSKAAESPVAKNECVAGPLPEVRRSEFSTRVR